MHLTQDGWECHRPRVRLTWSASLECRPHNEHCRRRHLCGPAACRHRGIQSVGDCAGREDQHAKNGSFSQLGVHPKRAERA